MIEADKGAVRVEGRLPCFNGFQLVAGFEHRVRQGPALNVRRVRYQGGPVPESDGFAIPLQHSLNVCLFADHRLAEEVVRDSGNRLHHPWRHCELEVSSSRWLRPPANETFRIAERRAPLRSVRN